VGTEFDYIAKEGFGWVNASIHQIGLQIIDLSMKEKLNQLVFRMNYFSFLVNVCFIDYFNFRDHHKIYQYDCKSNIKQEGGGIFSNFNNHGIQAIKVMGEKT
jgi:hypothetical protein